MPARRTVAAASRASAASAAKLRPPLAALVLLAVAVLPACQTTTTVNGLVVANPARREAGTTPAELRKRAEVRLQLASNYYTKGQFTTAIDEAHAALKLEPDVAQAYGLLGLIYSDLGDKGQAEANFQRALRLDPEDPALSNNYGWYLCQSGHPRESIAYFDRAATNRLYETPAMPLQSAGICMMQLGDLAAAENYLKRALETDATSPVAKFQLARLYLAKGQPDRANFYFDLLQKSIDPNPDSLWLGIRIAHAAADGSAERRLAEELRSKFPDSSQTAALNREAFNE